MRWSRRITNFLIRATAATVFVSACGGPGAEPPPKAAVPPADASTEAGAPAAIDPLGSRPEVPMPAPYTPPVPVSYTRSNGMKVWLLERHALPIVSMQIVVAAGSGLDFAGKEGLAYATANMLDEGAGKRGALDIARDIDQLGAALTTGAFVDYSFVELTSLKKNLEPAALILGDVVTKPTFSLVEWKRVHDLWENELRARQSNPHAVASVVAQRLVFGPSHSYGHPTSGTKKSAANVGLSDVMRFYKEMWRPEAATCVVVGDITQSELDSLLDKALPAWTSHPNEKSGGKRDKRDVQNVAPPNASDRRRVVVVDRPDAPQSVIGVARRSVSASDANAPLLARVNGALGGSFTSRLNQDLRESRGYSYGARSRFLFMALQGMFAAEAAVQVEHTGDALKAMLGDIEDFAHSGLTNEEESKTRMLARAELVEAYETVEATARRLGRIAGVGLPPEADALASKLMYNATKQDLSALANQYIDVTSGIVVIVGPRAKIEPQLKAIGIASIDSVGPEGE
ncbi:MAG: insulinase family protein [Polyangiaceae bacterium]|nr:insulinase family protein [Polyangiaceae bacterium]